MPDKLDMRTRNITQENIEKISTLFPHCVTEATDEQGKIRHLVDFESLKQELSEGILSDDNERYQFTWPNKLRYKNQANQTINKTLRPHKEESVNFDGTKNLYIEGDNLDALKLLRETYLGKVKMIYIDPPYNTGNDFVYRDDFTQPVGEYAEVSGDYNEIGDRLFRNIESNGRFHTDWLNMMYPRLKLARDFLSNDGVIFVSIDNNESYNLKKMCDEIFGEYNFVQDFIWQRAFSPKNDSKYASNDHDFILCYAKNIEEFTTGRLPRTEEADARYKNLDNDPRGIWISDNLTVKTYSESYDYPITVPSGRIVYPAHGSCWRISEERFQELKKDNRIWFGKNGDNVPRLKRFLHELRFDGMTASSIMLYGDVGHSQEGRQELKKLFDDKGYFDGPKPVRLLHRLMILANLKDNSTILDFFSGSSSTAHAVMKLNAENHTNRKFIMIQLPESVNKGTDAYRAGFENICEIGKERIRRAGKQILEENKQRKLTDDGYSDDLDVGFRVLKIDSSNMKDVYYTPDNTFKHGLDELLDNVKEDRTPEDLLFQVMLELGVELSATINEEIIESKKVFSVDEDYLVACFDIDVSENVVTEIAKKKPHYAVMRDCSMSNDNVAVNFEQIFKTYSPETIRRVI